MLEPEGKKFYKINKEFEPNLKSFSLVESLLINITHYQRNANQNHYEVPFHASQNGCNPKVYK